MSGPFTYPVAEALPFDNETNDFVSDNAQDAIEEARDTAPGLARASIIMSYNGTIRDDTWVGYTESIDSYDTPILIPWNCTLKEITFSNKRTSVDGKLNMYLNGTSSSDIVYTMNFSNTRSIIFYMDMDFVDGDLLRFRWVDEGQNPNDVGIVLFFLLR